MLIKWYFPLSSAENVKRQPYTSEEYESRLSLLATLYGDLERDFVVYTDFIPPTKAHLSVWSPKLIVILQRIGPHILDLLDLLTRHPSFPAIELKDDTFPSYLTYVDGKRMLKAQ